MNGTHYIGFDLHKKTISYCAKQLDGSIQDEGIIEATRSTIREWAAQRDQEWIGAMEATLFTGWIYDELKPHAVKLKVAHPAMLKAINSNTKLVMVVNPANPTATMIKPAEMKTFCEEASKKTTVLVDEAYIDFLDAPDNQSMKSLVANNENILVIRTFSKIHGMAGLRIGYIIGHPTMIKKLEEKFFSLSHFTLSNLSMAGALASLKDKKFRETSKQMNAAARDYTCNEIKELNFRCYPSYTNFIFFNLRNYSGDFSQYMLNQNIILRSNDYPDGKWCRVSVGTMDEMKQFCSVLKTVTA